MPIEPRSNREPNADRQENRDHQTLGGAVAVIWVDTEDHLNPAGHKMVTIPKTPVAAPTTNSHQNRDRDGARIVTPQRGHANQPDSVLE